MEKPKLRNRRRKDSWLVEMAHDMRPTHFGLLQKEDRQEGPFGFIVFVNLRDSTCMASFTCYFPNLFLLILGFAPHHWTKP